ncbi:hypothetical protein [Dankookia sp. P2]|uniref:hypothetical protein n=1 Tax=Dankookia sp. P2 TaxID=3423955 RepID=UPI003D675919
MGLPLHCAGPARLAALRDSLPAEGGRLPRRLGLRGRGRRKSACCRAPAASAARCSAWARARRPLVLRRPAACLPAGSAWRLADAAHAAPAVLGWCLGAYRYTRFKPAGRAPARLDAAAGDRAGGAYRRRHPAGARPE